jgi:acyl carrier protein
MDVAKARLIRCFAATFPHLTNEEITAATLESVAGWDSVATVTLLAIIHEEFGVELILDDTSAISFEAFLSCLRAEMNSSGVDERSRVAPGR